MGDFLRADVAFEGTRPLLWRAFNPHTFRNAAVDPRLEWKHTALVENSKLFLQPSYIFGAIHDGAKFYNRFLPNAIYNTLQIEDEKVFIEDRIVPSEDFLMENLNDDTLPIFVHVCAARNTQTKERETRYRLATASGWKCSFGIVWNKKIVPVHEMKIAITQAGKSCGLGDGRSIGYGRFDVTKFQAEPLPIR